MLQTCHIPVVLYLVNLLLLGSVALSAFFSLMKLPQLGLVAVSVFLNLHGLSLVVLPLTPLLPLPTLVYLLRLNAMLQLAMLALLFGCRFLLDVHCPPEKFRGSPLNWLEEHTVQYNSR